MGAKSWLQAIAAVGEETAMKSTLMNTTALVAAGIAVGLSSAEARAQATSADAPQTTGAEADARDSNVIIVTAQKREQSLQEVPLSITALTGDALADQGIRTLPDLETAVPGLITTSSQRPSSGSTVVIRGIGTTSIDGGQESSVGLFIDGVYRSRAAQGIGDLVDLEGIEVLRGPQGTLFGKNTSSGAIVARTKDPVFDFEGFAQATVGNFDLFGAQGALNVPLGEVAAFRVSGIYQRRDGFVEDVVTGADYNNLDRWALNAKLLFEPTDNLSVLIRGDISEIDENCCVFVRGGAPLDPDLAGLIAGLAVADGGVILDPARPEDLQTSLNAVPISQVDDKGLSIDITWEIGDVELFSQTSVRDYDSFSFGDIDFVGFDFLNQSVDFGNEQFSQELRLTGSFDSVFEGVDWLVGVYYAEEDVDWRDGVQYGQSAPIYFGALFRDPTLGALYAPNATTDGNVMQIGQSGETFAVFTHNIVDFTDRLQFVFGLRYTEETKDGTGTFNATSGPIALPFAAFPLPLRLSNDWAARFQDDAFSGTASMRYSWTDDVSTYLSYSRGFKSGGFSFERDGGGSVFSTDPTTDPSCIANGPPISPGGGGLPPIFACEGLIPEFGSETVDSFELGLRSVLADGALTLNATAFHSKYSDFQVTQFTGVGFVVTNAGSVTSKGFEIEANWSTPLEGLDISASVAYADVAFGSGVDLGPTVPNPEGQPPREAAEWQPAISANYRGPISASADIFLSASYSYTSEVVSELRIVPGTTDTLDFMGGLGLITLGGGIELDNGLELSVFCRNCSDERHPGLRIPAPVQPTAFDELPIMPREVGVSMKFSF